MHRFVQVVGQTAMIVNDVCCGDQFALPRSMRVWTTAMSSLTAVGAVNGRESYQGLAVAMQPLVGNTTRYPHWPAAPG